MFSLNHEAQIVQEIVEEQFEPKDNDMPDLVEIKPLKKKKFAAKFGKQIFFIICLQKVKLDYCIVMPWVTQKPCPDRGLIRMLI